MRYIQVPAPIQIRNPVGGMPSNDPMITLEAHATLQWLCDSRWYTPKPRLARLAIVQKAFEGERCVALEDADYEVLREIVLNTDPRNMYQNALVQAQFLPFDDAVLSASSSPPA
jgi:hypothetical protein